MGMIAPILGVVGSLVSGVGAASQANAQAQTAQMAAEAEALRKRRAADRALAVGDQEAAEERHKKTLAISRNRAVLGAAGFTRTIHSVDKDNTIKRRFEARGRVERNRAQDQANQLRDSANLGVWKANAEASATKRSAGLGIATSLIRAGTGFARFAGSVGGTQSAGLIDISSAGGGLYEQNNYSTGGVY